MVIFFFFFFQAEDGIRDLIVTGVQTCALPIFVRRGSLFQSTSDTEVIVHLIATSLKDTVEDRMVEALRQVEGAYSLGALTQSGLIGVRDPLGVRPLVLGQLGDAWIVSSETCALDIIGAEFVRDIEPGEIVTVNA